MPEILQERFRIDVDRDGFLVCREDWSEDVARVLAVREGIALLSEKQLDILRSLRDYHREHAFFPIVRAVCRTVNQPRTCVTDLFGDAVKAWKLAGLPNPGEEVLGFGSWEPLGY